MKKIKNYIKGNKLYQSLNIAKRFFLDQNLRDWIYSYDNSLNIAMFHEYGELNADKNIYLMNFDNATWGFFAYWKFGKR